jgi:hypothetical protein
MCDKREFAGLLLPDRLPETPDRAMTGPFLCRIAYRHGGGRLMRDWAILSWIPLVGDEGRWNLDGYDEETQVTSWQHMPPIPSYL